MVGRPFALVVLVALLPLAGCISGTDVPAGTEDLAPAGGNDSVPNDTLPDGRTFAAAKETNKTEEGLGGIAHLHDYWLGQAQVTVFEGPLARPLAPVFPSRDDTRHVHLAYAALGEVPGEPGRPALVFEGTGAVEFTITSGLPWAETYQLRFRTAATDWSEPMPLKVGETFRYEPAKLETDMPHSTRSLWNWMVVADGPVPVSSAPVYDVRVAGTPVPVRNTTNHLGEIFAKIVVHKAREVDDWPGHPAFYDGVGSRVVLEKSGKTSVQHAADVVVFGLEPDQLVPDRLISMGTDTLDVFVNITRIDSPVFPPTGFTLNWRHAAVAPFEIGVHQNANATDEKTTAYWHIKVDPDMLDAPYQPSSRWTFKVLMNTGNEEVARTYCYRCLPYTIEYTMTVVARPHPDAAAAALPDEA